MDLNNNIVTLDKLSPDIKLIVIDQIKNIFFEASSVKVFKDEESKAIFFKRWCGDYIEHYPHYFYLMFENQKLLGYLSGCLNTIESFSILNVPGVRLFSDLYNDYPAHLHINFSSDCRGKGLGSVLVEHYLYECKSNKVKGVHLITSQDAKNVSFYRKLGFTDEFPRVAQSFTQLLMGKKIE